jgi:transcriptional antiterminator RfaH
MQPYWLLLQTKSREESRAQEQLENQGCRVFCPYIGMEKISRGKRQVQQEPLFPGYLFLKIDDEQSSISFTSIRSTRGVSKIVRFGEDYTKLPQNLIDSILERVSQTHTPLSKNTPQPGNKVNITEGPFKGMEAIYQQADGAMRSMVLINLLHQQSSLTIENTAISL